jgi:uncharacterized protein YqhQ
MNAGRAFFLKVQGSLGHLYSYQPETIGGQAVVEGVLMRSPSRLSVAARAPDGSVALQSRAFTPFSRRKRILGWPILRGAASLIESLYIGMQALNWSISVQEGKAGAQDDTEFAKPATPGQKAITFLTLAASFAFALALFQLLPYATASYLVGGTRDNPANPLLFNATAGGVRITLLLTYMWALSFLPDIARLFQYHGAEHKSIFAYENKAPLEVADVERQSRFHPRCGTSFILIVALVCILFLSLLDAALLQFAGYSFPTFFHRFLIHLPFVPVVAGLAFEILKLSARHQNTFWIKPLVAPGLWLQKITTAEPDPKQIEVALASVKASLA